MNERLFNFVGGNNGPWVVEKILTCAGDPVEAVSNIDIIPGAFTGYNGGERWVLKGITSNERYVVREEKFALANKQEGLGRAASTRAALIPIRKNGAWWDLSQDERREIFEARSHHIAIGLKHLPAIARRLHHCRDLSPNEPFDFLTWFEYAPSDSEAFEDLVHALRVSPEWEYVDREVDIRLTYQEV